MFSPTDLVKVTNLTTKPLTITYNSRDFVLSPDVETPIPGDVAVLWFGDPRSAAGVQTYTAPGSEDKVYIPDRESEVRRLATKYGYSTGNINDYLSVQSSGDSLVPRVKITTLENEVVNTVLDDPTGSQGVEAVSPNLLTQEDELTRLRRQVDLLTKMMGQTPVAPDESPLIPADEPLSTPIISATLSNQGNEFPAPPEPIVEHPFGS